jgi:hypothetical protein
MRHTVTQCETRTQKGQKIHNLENLSIGKWKSCDTSDTMTLLCNRKSSNSLDPLKTAEGTIGAPTCLLILINFLILTNFRLEKVDLKNKYFFFTHFTFFHAFSQKRLFLRQKKYYFFHARISRSSKRRLFCHEGEDGGLGLTPSESTFFLWSSRFTPYINLKLDYSLVLVCRGF